VNLQEKDCIGIICGGGEYPELVAKSCVEKNINFCLIFLNGISSLNEFCDIGFRTFKDCESVENVSINIGEIGTAIDFLRKNNVKKVVFAGGVKRPDFKKLSLDAKGTSWLIKLGASIFSGDDSLLSSIASLMKNEGFEVVSGTDLIENTFISSGNYTSVIPTESEYMDIEKAFMAAKMLGKLDIGQAVIVHDGLILGLECVEGTDMLIDRCAKLRKADSGGILVKTSKPHQDQRMDLPSIGQNTIKKLHQYGFSGIALEAEKCILINRNLVIDSANKCSLFIYGCKIDTE
jgi:DUF1009 family protein